jgi:hypothetical protein
VIILFSYCRFLGLALAPWDVLASGRFRTDAEEKARQESGKKSRTFTPDGKAERNEDERKMCTALEKVAGEIGSKSIQAGASTILVLSLLASYNQRSLILVFVNRSGNRVPPTKTTLRVSYRGWA